MALRSIGLTILFVFALLKAAIAPAAILQTIDFEDGQTVQQSIKIRAHGNAADVVKAERGVTPRRGSWMQRTYLNRLTSPVTYRTESKVLDGSEHREFKKGEEYWVGLSVFIPSDWDMNYVSGYSDGIVWQFHDNGWYDNTWRFTLPLTAMHSPKGWQIRNHTWLNGKSSGNYKGFSVTVPYKLGEWNDFVINVKFSGNISPDDENGFIRVWVNGQKVVDRTGQNYFGEQTWGPYLHFGLYNWGWRTEHQQYWVGPYERTLWHDEVRIGDSRSSYAEVFPGASATAPKAPGQLSIQ